LISSSSSPTRLQRWVVQATGDLGIWVRPAPANATAVIGALSFGAPLFDLTVEDLTKTDTVFQIGRNRRGSTSVRVSE
jgi:hypothetical protein